MERSAFTTLAYAPSKPMQDPVATPHGIIFSREAILENLLAQKKAIRRKLAQWEAQQAGETRKVREPAYERLLSQQRSLETYLSSHAGKQRTAQASVC